MNLLKTLLTMVLKSALESRKDKIRQKLQEQIDATASSWVKVRNEGWLALLDTAGPMIVNQIEKQIKRGN